MGPAGEKLSRCERAVSGRAQERGAELACRVSGRAVSGRALRKKSSRAAGKNYWAQSQVGGAREASQEKLSRCERAVSGRVLEREAERACRFGPRAASVPCRAAR